MNDKKIIYLGLIIFAVIFTFPFWYNQLKASPAPEPILSQTAKDAKTCVEPKEFMKTGHMQLLNTWRDKVVREGMRQYKSTNGKDYNISLSSGEESCMGCHGSKADFCDKCHNYASVTPYCWDCHIEPKENK
ncbi:MAG: sulfate reduction electron transfer complex DsrMKJOP subunit DsrJ [Desulfobacterales bacterium]|nr:sulfate reduction electron transfer complex DsrMKJOP subunit DsrJ [Desulfobacterales bacterium]